jgi:aryl-alcohol dehydrogenase-like predicted oxidoreductase
VQSEYSIFSRDIEVDVIPACLEVGASLVAYSPLGRGILTGRFRAEKLGEGDWRSTTTRFQGEAYAANLALAEELEAVALAKSCTPAQIALAWVIGRGEHILALTGTTKLQHLKANLGACDLELSHAERMTLDALAARVLGDRYDTWGMAGING